MAECQEEVDAVAFDECVVSTDIFSLSTSASSWIGAVVAVNERLESVKLWSMGRLSVFFDVIVSFTTAMDGFQGARDGFPLIE